MAIAYKPPPLPDGARPVKTLTRDEWVRWHWVDVTRHCDGERMVVRGRERIPDEAAEANAQFDVFESLWAEARVHADA